MDNRGHQTLEENQKQKKKAQNGKKEELTPKERSSNVNEP